MKRILLVNPDFDSNLTVYASLARLSFVDKRAFMAPLPLATLAALTPDDFDVRIWDEAVHGRLDETSDLSNIDLVGITGYQAHAHRARQMAQIFRRRGILTVGGGPGVSAAPEAYRDDFDVLFVGEVEHVWKQFLEDWRAGEHRSEYRQIMKPDLDASPPPCWDSLAADMRFYFTGAVQTTRGCPFDCEFCDVIFLYGRLPRHKSVDQVIQEVQTLSRLGVDQVFFCDDNFIGNPKYTKLLLRELIPTNNSFNTPSSYSTQITLNVAKDAEILQLLADANFGSLYIGVETPNMESLKETNKPQNYRADLVEDIRVIHSYGMPVRAGMVVGFDNDDKDIFDRQFEFIQQACIPIVTINMLKAPLGTKLWARYHKEGRLLLAGDGFTKHVDDLTYADTNIIPKKMSRIELMDGYARLLDRVYAWKHFEERVLGFVSSVRRPPNVRARMPSESEGKRILSELLTSVDQTAANTILNILSRTGQIAPFMLGKVFGLIIQQIGVSEMAKALGAAVRRQIEVEQSIASMESFVDRRSIRVPDTFRAVYPELFGEMHQRLESSLVDLSRLPECMVEVFVDFLARWNDRLEQMEAHHRSELREIADRTVSTYNRDAVPGTMANRSEGYSGTKKLHHLRVETLKFVERDLRR